MIDLSENEVAFIRRIEQAFQIPVLVTGSVAINFHRPYREAHDLDLVVPAFMKTARWSDLFLWQRPSARIVDLDLVLQGHRKRYGRDYLRILSGAFGRSLLVRIHGKIIRVADMTYLRWIKRKLMTVRNKPDDRADLERLAG